MATSNAKSLIFSNTMTIAEFKAMNHMDVDTDLQVLENPKQPGNYFMKDPVHNRVLGACSSKVASTEGITSPVISQVQPGIPQPDGSLVPDTTKTSFFLLHQIGGGTANIVATF